MFRAELVGLVEKEVETSKDSTPTQKYQNKKQIEHDRRSTSTVFFHRNGLILPTIE